jgi:C-terminal processing protease CtpA/Prc
MPENEYFQFTAGRAVDMQGRIHIEGKGIAPTIQAPNTPATLFAQEFEQQDVVLDAALEWLREQSQE